MEEDTKTSEQEMEAVRDSEMEKLKGQCDEYLAGWKRAMADYQNLKKETDEKQIEFIEYANVKALLNFIPVYDNLQKAAGHIPDDQKKLAWVQGIAHIARQFEEVFKLYGLEQIVTAGATFDPQVHEAVSQEHGEGVPPGTIIREVASGYRMKGKVIVPAKVIVAE